ncbi:alpha/beta hydrolase family protein [Marinomonas foliarum]|uniref:Putative dienelactone hydrolase n=1 Tax=Marinomonas foliarum TaxID=491950 RepID=A0A368ZRY1_9GAMM|nr:alpha/beta fold hydrolase [Marinomonas foliarum]RCW95452.1 putative dienelactone hydrolase [Marinomonas foliarum]
MNNLVTESKNIPESNRQLTLSISPIALTIEGRETPLELRITLPVSGEDIPIILLSHGHGPSSYLPSKDGYAPLVNYYAEQGFAVIQPTHASSRVGGLDNTHPDAPLFLNERVLEMKTILDSLAQIERDIVSLSGRLDKERIAIVGHSAGAMTAAMLMGMTLPHISSVLDQRIKVGVLLAAVGKGGDDLIESARERFPEINPNYSSMTTKNLVVYGDQDLSPHFTTRNADWHADPYHIAPGSDFLLTLMGGKHGLGGIAGYDAKETDDEDPDRLAITQKMTAAYLKSALYEDDNAWEQACEALQAFASKQAYVESKH